MEPVQRWTLALCIFAMAFIFFYEARGERLIRWQNESAPPTGALLVDHYWQQTSIGTAFLVMGTLLMVVLRRPGKKVVFSKLELTAYALGIGVLLGTAVVSYMRMHLH